jgi:hypothetical protein
MTSPGCAPAEAPKIRGAVALALAVGTTRAPPEEVPLLPEELALDLLPLDEPLLDEPLLDVLPPEVPPLDVLPLEGVLLTFTGAAVGAAAPVVPAGAAVATGKEPLAPLQAARAPSIRASRQRRKVVFEIRAFSIETGINGHSPGKSCWQQRVPDPRRRGFVTLTSSEPVVAIA